VRAGHRFAISALAIAIVVGCATPAPEQAPGQPLAYSGGEAGDKLFLNCQGRSLIATPCKLGTEPSSMDAIVFTADPTRYGHMLKDSIARTLADQKNVVHKQPADVKVLRELVVEKCNPAAQSDSGLGELVQICVPSNPAKVVIFMRGLCDRCEFEPIVLTREVAKR
jgi:Fe-S cluster biogenesis protein NfuA